MTQLNIIQPERAVRAAELKKHLGGSMRYTVADKGEKSSSNCQNMPQRARRQAFSFPRSLPSDVNSNGEKPEAQGRLRPRNQNTRSADDLLCSQRIDHYICGCTTGVYFTRISDCGACQDVQQATEPQARCQPRLFPMHIPRWCDKCLNCMEDRSIEHPCSPNVRTLEVQRILPDNPQLELISSPHRESATFEMEGSGPYTRRRARKAAPKRERAAAR